MPNPLDRQPSPTPEAGTFARLGVENVGESDKVLGVPETDISPDDTLSKMPYEQCPHLVETRKLLIEQFPAYGIYSKDDDNQLRVNTIVGHETLSRLHRQAEDTWSHIENNLVPAMSNSGEAAIHRTIKTQRELAPSYALLPSSRAHNIIVKLSLLSQLEPSMHILTSPESGVQSRDKGKSFTGSNAESGCTESRNAVSLTSVNKRYGNKHSAHSVSFAETNGINGNIESPSSVSFAHYNLGHGVIKSDTSTSFARVNSGSTCYDTSRTFAATLKQYTSNIADGKKSWLIEEQQEQNIGRNLVAVIGRRAINPTQLFKRENRAELDQKHLIIIEDREDQVNDKWRNEARSILALRDFYGALIVGGKKVYEASRGI